MKYTTHALAALFSLVAFSVACSQQGGVVTPRATCGTPPAGAYPQIGLAYPEPDATGVPLNLPELVLQGLPNDAYGYDDVTLFGAIGSPNLAAPSPVPAPSPLPSPLATIPALPNQFFAVTITSALAPNTTYVVSIAATIFAGSASNNGSCTTKDFAVLGTFITAGAAPAMHRAIVRR